MKNAWSEKKNRKSLQPMLHRVRNHIAKNNGMSQVMLGVSKTTVIIGSMINESSCFQIDCTVSVFVNILALRFF